MIVFSARTFKIFPEAQKFLNNCLWWKFQCSENSMMRKVRHHRTRPTSAVTDVEVHTYSSSMQVQSDLEWDAKVCYSDLLADRPRGGTSYLHIALEFSTLVEKKAARRKGLTLKCGRLVISTCNYVMLPLKHNTFCVCVLLSCYILR